MLGGQVGLSLAVDLAIFVWGVSWRRKKIDILRQGMLGEAEICGITSSMWGFKLKVTVNGFEAVEYVPRYMVDYLQKVKESPDNRLDVIYSPDIPGEVIIPLKSILKAR